MWVRNTLDTTTETWPITGVHNTLDTTTQTWTITWQKTTTTKQQQQADISLTWQESCDWACVVCWTSAQGSGRWAPGMRMMCDVCRPWSGDPRQAALRTSHSGNPAHTQPHKMHVKPPAQCSAQIQNCTFTLSATLWRTHSIRFSYVTLHVVNFALNNCCWGFSYYAGKLNNYCLIPKLENWWKPSTVFRKQQSDSTNIYRCNRYFQSCQFHIWLCILHGHSEESKYTQGFP